MAVGAMFLIMTVVVVMSLISIVIKFCLFTGCKSENDQDCTKKKSNGSNAENNLELTQLVDSDAGHTSHSAPKILVHSP